DLFAQRKARRFLCCRLAARRTIECLDALESRLLSGRIEDDLVARRNAAAIDGSGDDTPVVAVFGELVHALDGHPKRPRDHGGPVLEPVERLEDGWSVVPGKIRRSGDKRL